MTLADPEPTWKYWNPVIDLSKTDRQGLAYEVMRGRRSGLVRWGTYSLILTACGVGVAIVGTTIFASVSPAAVTIAALLFLLSAVSYAMCLVYLGLWLIARARYRNQFSVSEWKDAYNLELRGRGAPGWYVHASRRGRTAYVLLVLFLALGMGVLRFEVGSPNLGLALIAYIAAFSALALVFLFFQHKH